ncbi:MAG: Ig-like domain-containing protein, partial [Candidatus Marinimicrobia bacterium]|nr:Ig-like domain-containing protein [Candidatus Neomarinimicrobiota bacterium]
TEFTEADCPYSHLAASTTEDDEFDQCMVPYPGEEAHANGANGADYTYKLTLSQPAVIYVTTCDELTNIDVQIGIYTADCDETSWVFFQDDSNTPIYYPDETNESFDFSCISGFESAPQYANMLPNIEWDAGTYYIVVDDRAGTPGTGSVKTWMGYSLLVDSTSTSGDFEEVNYYFSEGVFGGEYSDVYYGNGIGLETGDYSVEINPNGGNADEANLTSLESATGGALAGGEETVVLNLEYPNTPSGGEILTVGPASVFSIFNSVGVPLLDVDGISISLIDVLAPTIDFTDPENNSTDISTVSNISIAFTEAVQNSIDAANITYANFILEEAVSGEILAFDIMSSDQIGFEITPDVQLPELTAIKLSILSTIEDVNNNGFQFDTLRFLTADESPPQIDSSAMSSINDYVAITFNEGVFSTNNGSGGLDVSDLNYTFNANGGNCENLTLTGITSNGGGALVGGESTIHALISLSAAPSGVETITLFPADNTSIFDAAGNSMNTGEISDEVTLLASALLISTDLADSNVYVDLGFSVGIYGNAYQSLAVYLEAFESSIETNSGTATTLTLTSVTNLENNVLTGGEDSVRIHMVFNELPSGVETITLSPATDFSIYSISGVSIPNGEIYGPIDLYDEHPPVGVDDVDDGETNVSEMDTITISFNENIYFRVTGNQVTLGELAPLITLKYDNNSGADIPFLIDLINDPPIISIYPAVGYDSESIVYYNFTAVMQDVNENRDTYNFNATFTVRDYLAPAVDSSALAFDNSYLDLIFDEEIYGTDQETGAIEETVIQIEFFNNGSITDTVMITSLTRTDSNFLIGGEQSVRVNLEYNSTPSGDETMVVTVNNGVSIYDDSGNQMAAQALTDT